MGPGMIVKAMVPRHFSIIACGITQVLVDLEVLWNMERNNTPLHTFFHTYLGVSLVVLIAIPLGKTLSTSIRRIWNFVGKYVSSFDMKVPEQTTWTATILGASIGAYSHILFDSFYHLDIEPFQPWSDANPCKGLIDPSNMEIAFNLLFIIGLLWFIIGEILRKRTSRVALICLLAGIVGQTGCSNPSKPTVETTVNQNAVWCRNWFEMRLLSLQKEGESAIAVYGRKTDNPKRITEKWTTGFVVQWPDDHGSASYTADSINQDGVSLSYTMTFDHRSFGKNLKTKDSGTFRLSWSVTEFLRYEGVQPTLTVSLLPSSKATPEEITRVGDTAKRVFNQLCAIKSEVWPEPAAIKELADVWHVEFQAKDRVLSVNGKQTTVKTEAWQGMRIPLMKPDLTCALLGDPIKKPEAKKVPKTPR